MREEEVMARRSRCETINKDVSEKLLSCIMVLVLALYYGTRTGLCSRYHGALFSLLSIG